MPDRTGCGDVRGRDGVSRPPRPLSAAAALASRPSLPSAMTGRLTGVVPSTIVRDRQDWRSVALGSGMAGNGLSGGRTSRLASCGRAVASRCRRAAPMPAAPTM